MTGTECLVLTAGHTLARLTGGDEVFAVLERHQAESLKVRAEVVAAQDTPSWDLALLKDSELDVRRRPLGRIAEPRRTRSGSWDFPMAAR